LHKGYEILEILCFGKSHFCSTDRLQRVNDYLNISFLMIL